MPRTASRDFTAPDPTPILFLVAAGIALLWAAEYGQASLLVAGGILLPFLLFQFSRHRLQAAAALIIATALPRFFLELSSLKARPEHIAVGTLILLIPFWIKRSSFRPTWIVADILLLAYVAGNIFSSWYGSPAPQQTLRWAIQQAMVIAPYFLLRLLTVDEPALRRVFRVLLVVGTLEAAYVVICFFSSMAFGSMFGMEPEAYGTVAAPFGTQLEPNIVGSYSGACLVMLLVIYFLRPRKKLIAAIAITAAGSVLSLSRGAVAATVIALIVTFYCGIRARQIRRRTVFTAGFAVLAAWLAVAPAIASVYQERFKTVTVADVAEDETVAPRLLINVLAFQDILDHPLYGTGTASFQVMVDAKELGGEMESGWIGNTELRIMHDTGSIGLALFLSFLILLVRNSVRLLKLESHPELLALLLGGIVYCMAFQATEGTLLAFSWVHFGLIGCALALSPVNREIKANKIREGASA